MKIVRANTTLACLAFMSVGTVQLVLAADVEELTDLVHNFLANADEEAAHESFWAEDLVYTSSSGLRFGKAEIMSGFVAPEAADSTADEEPAIEYSGEDIDVRLYGDTAIVAFRLVGTPSDGSAVSGYFNTGTFLRRDGVWQVIAWQATKIPPP